MLDKSSVSRVTKYSAAVVLLFWWLVVLGGAPQVPFSFPITLENPAQFLLLFFGVFLIALASLIDEAEVSARA